MNRKPIFFATDRMRTLLHGDLNDTDVVADIDHELGVLKQQAEADAAVRVKVAVIADLLKRLKMVTADSTTVDLSGSGCRIKQDLSTTLDSIDLWAKECS